MALNVKIGLIGAFDMLKFKKMSAVREQAIQAAPAKEVVGSFPINENAKAFHPDFQKMVIEDIIDHKGAESKTYVLRRTDGKPAALFRAGQYTSVSLQIGESRVTRTYSICSSPKEISQGKYEITVRTNPGGFAAEWILANWAVGQEVVLSGGEGFLYYEGLRDSDNIVALAGGSGITPFLSMARAIRDGVEGFNLTIIFGSRTEEQILFKDEFDAIMAACPKVKVIHVLSDEEREGYEHGFITAELVKKYAPEDYCIYICGPEAMYRFTAKELEKLSLPIKKIRHEPMGVTKTVWEQPGYPVDCKGKTFKVTVKQGAESYDITASADEPLLVAMERAGIKAPSRCRGGECGWCRSRLLEGKVFVPPESEERRWADVEYGYIHPCCSFPVSDALLEVPGAYLG